MSFSAPDNELEPHRTIRYRPEIDGLRAVAVLPVILWHAGLDIFSGGFVGVDVFFVISGYLITQIIIGESVEGRFSLTRFYERRARRILPALILVMLCCIPFAWFWMLPDPLENFGQSVFATLFFANNILLRMTSGYWELASEFKPLVHTWSLGLEEQYYLLFPLLVIGLWRFGQTALLRVIIGISLVSLAMTEIFSRIDPDANFYLLHTRAWELLAGSICSFLLFGRPQRHHDMLAAAGLGLILFAIFRFDEQTPFPSLYALAPVVGTALVIMFADGRTWVARILSIRVFVGVGLISYSLYLWHQVLFAFARINSYDPPPQTLMLSLVAATFVLSYLSWRFVETPFRSSTRVRRVPFVASVSVATAGLAAFGLFLHFEQGVPLRIFSFEDNESAAGMHLSYNRRISRNIIKVFPDNGKPNVLVLGNSFARDFINMGVETGHFSGHNLAYSGELDYCISSRRKALETHRRLLEKAETVIYASGDGDLSCVEGDIAILEAFGVRQVLFVGPKNFGYNLNKFVQIDVQDRASARARISAPVMATNDRMKRAIGPDRFIDIIGLVSEDGRSIPVFTESGHLISPDRKHLTRKGARFMGLRVFRHPLLQGF